MESEKRYRNFATIVYPDSAQENWKDILQELKIPALISPIHDKDINPTNEKKKPHYHILLSFEGKKSTNQVKEIFEKIGGVGCEVVSSMRAYARYLCHLDNPEKAQYNVDNVISLGGLNYRTIIGSMADKNKCISDMIDHINDNDLDSFAELVCYAKNFKPDWFDCLLNSGSYFIKEYIKSRTWKLHQYEEK